MFILLKCCQTFILNKYLLEQWFPNWWPPCSSWVLGKHIKLFENGTLHVKQKVRGLQSKVELLRALIWESLGTCVRRSKTSGIKLQCLYESHRKLVWIHEITGLTLSVWNKTSRMCISPVSSLLQLVMASLQHLQIPSSVAEKKAKFSFVDKPLVSRLLLDFMMDMLLLPYR